MLFKLVLLVSKFDPQYVNVSQTNFNQRLISDISCIFKNPFKKQYILLQDVDYSDVSNEKLYFTKSLSFCFPSFHIYTLYEVLLKYWSYL